MKNHFRYARLARREDTLSYRNISFRALHFFRARKAPDRFKKAYILVRFRKF